MRILPVRSGLFLAAAFAVAACGGTSAPTVQPSVPVVNAPSTAAPSIAAPSVAAPSVAAPTFAIPSFVIPSGLGGSFAFPSFNTNADPALAARFPTTIGGQPVMDVLTYSFSDFVSFATYGDPAAAQGFLGVVTGAGIDPSSATYGEGDVTLNEDRIAIVAIHTTGGDASKIVTIFPQIYQALHPDEAAPTVQQANIGGKAVITVTNAGGEVTYVYPQGDVAWTIDGADDTEAATVLQALP